MWCPCKVWFLEMSYSVGLFCFKLIFLYDDIRSVYCFAFQTHVFVWWLLTIYDLLAFLKFWISECKIWGSHCKACHSDARWRAERERTKRAPTQTASASSVASARSTAISRSSSSSGSLSSSTLSRFSSSSTLSTGSNAASRSAEFSVRNLLGQVTAVHPVEMQPPAGRGFVTPLRHYQKQSLAFIGLNGKKPHTRWFLGRWSGNG